MGFTTFSGPVRSGTVRQGANTALNTGTPVLAQTAVVGFASVTTSPTAVALFTLPAGAKIVRFNYDKTTAFAGNGVTAVGAQIGTAGSAALYQASVAVAITAGKTSTATVDAGIASAQTDNIGTADVTLYGTFTATTGNPTSGSMTVTVEYLQRAADGTQNPA